MAYTALYRKFRPDNFSEVKGQEDVVRTLRNQITSDRIGHAYLFCGTRGTGKTTVAKILAKAINCENPQDGNPCNECAVCKAIAAGNSMNVVEIDAASNNGVENIREIVEEVRYSPTEGKYRVYIIDEVHMLSIGAFNALLKTLEEPPSYVVFILATTEAHKIPITILSRCQRYDFKRIRIETIADRLMDLCRREGVNAEEKAMFYVAKVADGSMRDALSLLERCVSFFYKQDLTYDRVLDILGTVDIEVFGRMLRHVRDGKVIECMNLLDEMVVSGRELSRFVVDFTWYMRNLLLAASGEDLSDVLEVSGEQMEMLIHEAQVFDIEQLMGYIAICCELTNQIRYATQKRVIIEMAFIRLCRPQTGSDNSAVLERIRHLESEVENLRRNGVALPAGEEPSAPEEMEEEIELPKALPEDIRKIAEDWKGIIRQFPQPGRLTLQSCIPSVTDNGRLLLLFDNLTDYTYMNTEEKHDMLVKHIAGMVKVNIDIDMKLLEKGESKAKYADITVINSRLKNLKIEITEE
ncbi:MAG: DNA polymerase III subunit gamma/tau [Lachnospiraceae bacterium]|nr:DNA polymerase III subunit gamma/tau [Lachnospiraceae bacterium]